MRKKMVIVTFGTLTPFKIIHIYLVCSVITACFFCPIAQQMKLFYYLTKSYKSKNSIPNLNILQLKPKPSISPPISK
jgi:hypothetical protein